MLNPPDLRIALCKILIQLHIDEKYPVRFLKAFPVLPVAAHVSRFSNSEIQTTLCKMP